MSRNKKKQKPNFFQKNIYVDYEFTKLYDGMLA